MKTQTNARVMPAYVLAETGRKGTLNHAGAFTRPVNDRRTNNILASAIERLRAYSTAYDAAYGLFDGRAELLVAPAARESTDPQGWKALDRADAAAFADWVADQVRSARPA